jgi:hypothetical protein
MQARSLQRSKSRATLKLAVLVIFVASLTFFKEQRSLSSLTAKFSVLRPLSSQSTATEQYGRSPPFRMLLGIFSMESEIERQRRNMIKNTYLSFPKFMNRYNVTTVPLRYTRICSLNEFWHGNLTQRDECQLLYTFVVGAANKNDPNASKEYLDLEDDRSMAVDESAIPNRRPDSTYLNIIENMNEGKSQTWFKYASSQIPDELQIDLIAKVDTDCLIYPTKLLSEIERIRRDMSIPYPLHHIYGGSRQRGKDVSYMQGGFYFTSQDVARYITSDQCDRDRIIEEYKPDYKDERAEDVEMSRFIRSYPRHVYEMEIPRATAYVHEGKYKHADPFRDNWKWYIATIVARDRITKVQRKTNSTCPPDESLDEELALISEDLVRMRSRYALLRKQLQELCNNVTRTRCKDNVLALDCSTGW